MLEKKSDKWKLNKTDGLKILKSMALALSGPVLDVLSATIFKIDFGEYTHIVYVVTPVVVNLVRKILQGK